jgi:peptidoglycan/xylan/chitin deacetylase (PgdA/CDA1 family)
MKTVIFSVFALFSAAVMAANPLELTCYNQSFSVTFPSVEAAQKAQLVPRRLPEKFDVAFSSRWDDGTMSHLNTHKIMSKYGAKGNFFVGSHMAADTPVLEHIVKNGCLVGVHTVGHHPMKYLTANCHFYQYMANRIALEVKSQTPVNTQASPYGHNNGVKKDGTRSIGKSVLATGIIGSLDGNSVDHIKAWGFPENGCSFVYRVIPGDRVPDMKKLEQQLAAYMKNPDFKKNPTISMSTHSWHTKEGLVILDEIYKKFSLNKNWWNCNQNEFAAYTYETLNTEVKKEVTGKTVKFTVLRFEPFELGADVPLYFDITGESAVSVEGAELADGGKQIKAKHSNGHSLPSKYGYLKLDKVTLKLAVSENDGKITAVVNNESGKVLSNVTYIFRKPPMYAKVVERVAKESVQQGDTVSVETGKVTGKSRHFQIGKPYYAVQMDYTIDGKRHRLYADTFTAERSCKVKTIGDAAIFIQRTKNNTIDAQQLSLLETSLKGMKSVAPQKDIFCAEGTVYPGKNLTYPGYIAIVDIQSDSEQNLKISYRIDKQSRFFFNGTEMPKKRGAVLQFKKGINRLVIEGSRGSSHIFSIKGKVNYITPETK